MTKCMCATCCCKSETSIKENLWQLKLNWVFLMSIASLYSISYTSISSSFHQFITNPTDEELSNSSGVEPGLGQSEVFYSWVITLFNLGALIGAIGTGCLVKFIPYWHLILMVLISHTIGYVLYAISNAGWVIMLSKLLSGVYIGGEMTLSLSYFAESSVEYIKISSIMGRDTKAQESGVIRSKLFAWHNIGVGIGYILGPGAAAVFSQFDIDQFRSIAWYNVAFGVLFILLLFALFHGESGCSKVKSRCKLCKFKVHDSKCDKFEIFILVFLILCRGVLSFRFGVYETIYNPVLSDYFGFDERSSSYFFFALVLAQISGTILLLVLQQIKLNSRVIAIIGLSMSVLSCTLIADWQSIPFDECTKFSPYHNPKLLNSTMNMNLNHISMVDQPSDSLNRFQIELKSDLNLKFEYDEEASIPTFSDITFTCFINGDTSICTENQRECLVLHYEYGSVLQLEKVSCDFISREGIKGYLCDKRTFSLCLYVNTSGIERPTYNEEVHGKNVYNDVMEKCTRAISENQFCNWIPDSIITKQYCYDCRPICRSPAHSLDFVQFCIGAAVLMLSIPVAWVPVAALVSERVNGEMQGIMMGIIVALTAIGRSVSPLWLDAAYEGVMKRTFLAMIIMIITHLPFLIGFVVLYQKLAPPHSYSYSKKLEESDTSDED